jgi:ribosome-binding protein aMBF1 (putative translation factor)
MQTAQINFRIDPKLLKDIKQAAKKNDQAYTQWIIDACKDKLGQKAYTLEEISQQLDQHKTQLSQHETRLTQLEQRTDGKKDSPTHTKENLTQEITNKLTNAQLAKKIGVDPSTISRWATGKRQPPFDLEYSFDPTLKLWIKCET